MCVDLDGRVSKGAGCCVYQLEADILVLLRRVEAVRRVDFRHILRFRERDISALHVVSRGHVIFPRLIEITYIVKRSSVLRCLNNLDRRVVAHLRCIARRQRHLRQTKRSIVLHI